MYLNHISHNESIYMYFHFMYFEKNYFDPLV